MKIHLHSEQFDGSPHPQCGRGASAVAVDIFEASEPTLRCKLCERYWFPSGQPKWHHQAAVKNLRSSQVT